MITLLLVSESSQPGRYEIACRRLALQENRKVEPHNHDMHADKKNSDLATVCSWSPEAAKLNSGFSRVARHSLPAAPL